jgi:outer membrane protein assembly factor BamB
LPIRWSETENVRWKTEIPGRGWSSPVIWDRQVWLTTATQEGHSLRAVCVDRDSGAILHDMEVFRVEAPPAINDKNSHASPTPVVEAGRAYVSFGSHGLACLDTKNGAVIWRQQGLTLDHKEGAGSSPVPWKDKLLTHCDGVDVQYVAALDKQTGEIAWRHQRQGIRAENPDFRKAYCTPLVVEVDDQWQMIAPGADRVTAYDPQTGREIWTIDYGGFSNVPRPIVGHGLAFVCTGYMSPQLYAIRLTPGEPGDVAANRTSSHLAWKVAKQIPANPSPLLIDEAIYLVSDQGVASCFDAHRGEERWQERLGGTFSASPIYADGRIYLFSEDGEGVVLKPGDQYEELGRGQLSGRIMASPAALGRALFVRTDSSIYRLEVVDLSK